MRAKANLDRRLDSDFIHESEFLDVGHLLDCRQIISNSPR